MVIVTYIKRSILHVHDMHNESICTTHTFNAYITKIQYNFFYINEMPLFYPPVLFYYNIVSEKCVCNLNIQSL